MTAQDATKTPDGKATPDALYEALDRLNVAYSVQHHPPVYTVAEAKELRGEIDGAHCKSLFLRNKKGAMWLVVCLEWRRMEMKALSGLLGSGRLSFGSAERLAAHLGVIPGAVTPFAAINDRADQDGPLVQVVLDAEMMRAPAVNFHPLVNNATVNLTPDGLRVFLEDCGHAPLVLDLREATAE